jgi:hypothetical protein
MCVCVYVMYVMYVMYVCMYKPTGQNLSKYLRNMFCNKKENWNLMYSLLWNFTNMHIVLFRLFCLPSFKSL